MGYRNILVVEDEKNISDVVSAYLINEKFNVFLATDGEMAMDLFTANDIHEF